MIAPSHLTTSLLLALLPACSAEDPSSTIPEFVFPDRFQSPVASPDGERLVSLDGEVAWLIDTRDGLPLLAVETGSERADHDPWTRACFSPDGGRLVLWGIRGATAWIDVPGARVIRRTGLLVSSGSVSGRTDGANLSQAC